MTNSKADWHTIFQTARRACGALVIGFVLQIFVVDAESAQRSPAQGPFYITPHVESLLLCDKARDSTQFSKEQDAVQYCVGQGLDGATRLAHALDELEPGGAQGSVQMGYTLTIPLLSLYAKSSNGSWQLDDRLMDAYVRLISETPRPVVVYLSATHFDTTGPLSSALAHDHANLMKLSDGKPPQLSYFEYGIIPFTLRVDEQLDVNRYRFTAMQRVAERLKALPESVQRRIVAITLAGEAHQLFPDFEGGTGRYKDIQVTDYDPASVASFRDWLAKKYQTVQRMKAQTGLDYPDFQSIQAPSKDIRRDKLTHFGEHYDAYADGTVPVSGWLWDPTHRVQALLLYVDGDLVGPVAQGFNRLDVYRAKAEVTSPNVGFRHDLDYAQMAVGKHRLQVVAQSATGEKYLVGERTLVVVPRDQSIVSDRAPDGLDDWAGQRPGWRRWVPQFLLRWFTRLGWISQVAPTSSMGPDVQWWLDMPQDLLDVYYNPLARDWNAFRSQQVYQFLATVHAHALAAGLPRDKLYSHQIAPRANSSWNPQLFAVDETLGGALPWKPGFNLYGGATNGPWLQRFLSEKGITDYGVPEMHTQQTKLADAPLDALRAHYAANARFVSPMYMSLLPERFRAGAQQTDVRRMELRPDNPADGSAALYEAMRTLARE